MVADVVPVDFFERFWAVGGDQYAVVVSSLDRRLALVKPFVDFSPEGWKQGQREVSVAARFELPGREQEVQEGGGARSGHPDNKHRPVGFRELRGYELLELKAGGLDDL